MNQYIEIITQEQRKKAAQKKIEKKFKNFLYGSEIEKILKAQENCG